MDFIHDVYSSIKGEVVFLELTKFVQVHKLAFKNCYPYCNWSADDSGELFERRIRRITRELYL